MENVAVQQGLHSDSYRSLLEQKQHQKIEELLEAKKALEQRANEAEQVASGFSEQTNLLVQELEASRKENAVLEEKNKSLEEKNKSFLKLVASLKQQVKDAQSSPQVAAPMPPASLSPRSRAPSNESGLLQQVEVLKTRLAEALKEKDSVVEQFQEQVAALESEIRQKDAISGMQQRSLEDTNKKMRELGETVEQLMGQVQAHQDGVQELQLLRLQNEEKAVLAEECQRLRDRVERAERELTRSKSDQRLRANNSNNNEEAQRLREKLETQLRAARDEASAAVSEQFVLNQRNEELSQANSVLRIRLEEMQAEISHLASRANPSFLLEKERQVTDLNGQLAAAQKELAAVTSAAAKGRAAEQLQARVKELEEQLAHSNRLKNELAAKEQEISRLQGESEGRIAALAVADKMIKTLEAKRDSMAAEVRAASNRVQELENSAREASSQGSVLQSLVKKLQEEITILTREKEELINKQSVALAKHADGKELENLQSLLAAARTDLARLISERNSLQQRLQEGEGERTRLAELKDDLARVVQERNSVRDKLEVERATNAEMRSDMTRVIQERNGLRERLEGLSEALEASNVKERHLNESFSAEMNVIENRLAEERQQRIKSAAQFEEEHSLRVKAEEAAEIEKVRLQRELDEVVRRLSEERAQLIGQVDSIKRAFEEHKVEAQELKRSHERRKQKVIAFKAEMSARLEKAEQVNRTLLAEREEWVSKVDRIKKAFEQQQADVKLSQDEAARTIQSLKAELSSAREQLTELASLKDLLNEARGTITRLLAEREVSKEELVSKARAIETEQSLRVQAERLVEAERSRLQRELDEVVRRLSEERAQLIGQVDSIKRAFEEHKVEAQELKRSHERRKQKVIAFKAEMSARLEKAEQVNRTLLAEREEWVSKVDRIKKAFEQQQADVKLSQDEAARTIQSLKAELSSAREQLTELASLKDLLNEARGTITRVMAERDNVRHRLEEELSVKSRVAAQFEEERLLRFKAEEAAEAERSRLQRELDGVVRRLSEERAQLIGQVDSIKRAFEEHKVEAQELKRSHTRRKQKVEAFRAETMARLEEERKMFRSSLQEKERLLENAEGEKNRLARELEALSDERADLTSTVGLIQRTFEQYRAEEGQKSRAFAELKAEKEGLEREVESLRRSVDSSKSYVTETNLLKKLLSEARADLTRLLGERDVTRNRLEEALEAHDKTVDSWKSERESLQGQIGSLQLEVSRLVQERQRSRAAAAESEEMAEIRRQRDTLRETVKKLQHQQVSQVDSSRLAQLQAQLAAERNVSEGLRRRIERERLGSRLEALDTVGKQIQDLKHVLSGDWSSISIANTSGLAESAVRRPQRNSGFVSPATPMGRRADAPESRLTDALDAERKRLDRSQQQQQSMI